MRECATTCLPRQQAPSARPPSVRATMAVGTAQRVSLRALRAAKAAHGVGSAPPDMRVAVVSARLPRARSSPARGRTALRLPPGGASYGSVNCAARLPAPSERAAALVPRTPRAARRNLPPRAAAADDLGSHTISVRVRLSDAAGPAGDLVLSGVAPGSTTARALVARWAAELGVSAAPCTAVARADGAGADEVPLHDPDATLSAAGVADGGVVLVELAGVKLITLRLSAQKECTVPLHGALGMTNLLRRYNAVALRKAALGASPSPPRDTEVFEFESLESGAAYAPVPRAPPPPPPAVHNVTLSRELLRPCADGSTLPPLLFANLTNGVLQSQLRDMRAAGVSATREPLVLLCDVAELTDGATYYVAPPGDMGEAESLKQQARGALGAKRPLRGVGASDAALAYTALLS